MKFRELSLKIKQPIFSLQELKIAGLNILPYQLSKWAARGYLIKIKNGLYLFADKKDGISMEYISSRLYEPSYVSLERALSRYGLIPEMVYNSTAVTAKRTRTFQNDFGVFIYRSIRQDLFFGYVKVKDKDNYYLLAEPEKAVLDYLYLNSAKIKNNNDIRELRFNENILREFNGNKLAKYQKMFNSKKLNRLCDKIFK